MSLTRKLRVAVLFGGRSAEHAISLLSARFVIASLDPERYEVLPIGIDKNGRWVLQDASALLNGPRDPRLVKLNPSESSAVLAPHPALGGQHLVHVEERGAVAFDLVFPVLHGPLGEDGTLQGLLELAGVPYVGSGVLGSAVGMDKDVMKRLLLQAGLPVLPYRLVRRAEWLRASSAVLSTLAELALPVFVKPANLGSSVGIARVTESEQLEPAIRSALQFDDKVVVECGLERPREIECALLGGEVPRVSVPGEISIDHADGFYSYQAKYVDESGATLQIPAPLQPEEQATAQRLALATFEVLEAEGLARVDLFLSREGVFYVNEINTMPGFTAVSMFPRLWAESGVPNRVLMNELIDDALLRAARRRARRTAP